MWDNHEKALGNLHTLNSPFFKDEYVPEAGILEAVIFFANYPIFRKHVRPCRDFSSAMSRSAMKFRAIFGEYARADGTL